MINYQYLDISEVFSHNPVLKNKSLHYGYFNDLTMTCLLSYLLEILVPYCVKYNICHFSSHFLGISSLLNCLLSLNLSHCCLGMVGGSCNQLFSNL